jgi:uncharacterized membrane protein HdeD (DUF308 family)
MTTSGNLHTTTGNLTKQRSSGQERRKKPASLVPTLTHFTNQPKLMSTSSVAAAPTPVLVPAPIQTAQALRTLYFVRAAFSVVWVSLVFLSLKSSPTLTAALLLLYPAWDVLATFGDIRANRSTGQTLLPQYVNIAVGSITTVAVGLALRQGIPQVLIVFGIWAVLTGLIQLLLGLRRRRQLGGQWPMILSGGQSVLAGVLFVVQAHDPSKGVVNVAGYSAVGAIYFLIAALRLRKSAHPTT